MSARAVIELCILGVTLTLAVGASGAQAFRRASAARALDRYAQSRGLRFVPAPSSPRGASPRVLGSRDDVDYMIDLFRLGTEQRTRAATAVPRGVAPTLSVAQRGTWSRIEGRAFALEGAYIVLTGGSDALESLEPATRPLLVLAKRSEGVWLVSNAHRVSLSWRGFESDPIVLDAARDVVVAVASVHRPASPYR